MEVRKIISWFIICCLIFGLCVKGDSVKDSINIFGFEIPKNESALDILKVQVSDYIKLFCDVGLQVLVSNPVCAKHLEYICKRNDIFIQSKWITSNLPDLYCRCHPFRKQKKMIRRNFQFIHSLSEISNANIAICKM